MKFNFKIGSLLNLLYFELWIGLTVSFEELYLKKKIVLVLNKMKICF